ncbi:hypothetical protein OKW22_001266 [Bacilli bacterium PM5-3]|nr:hypothetical protein [Bacilli bacterium PM5-3]
MILSVSRRSDIPAFYGEWFIKRLLDKKFYVRNPYNHQQISLIEIENNLDCIVFWTKDAIDFMQYLLIIDNLDYDYYFHYTITSYHTDIEILKHSKKEIINNFIELSKKLGKERVILRYDPIIITDKYTIAYHLKMFEKLCQQLHQYTNKIVISFLDEYQHINKSLNDNNLRTPKYHEIMLLVKEFVEITNKYNLKLTTCAEAIDLTMFGIEKNSCIDKELIEQITKRKVIKDTLDKTRDECLCLKCIDIGTYSTCLNDCRYCYAKSSSIKTKHNSNSLLLNDEIDNEIIIKRKDTKSILSDNQQISLDI